MFQISLHNQFEVLQSNESGTVEQRWSTFEVAVVGACENISEENRGLLTKHGKR